MKFSDVVPAVDEEEGSKNGNLIFRRDGDYNAATATVVAAAALK